MYFCFNISWSNRDHIYPATVNNQKLYKMYETPIF